MRVGIVALLQETNTFIDGSTTLAHFEQDLLADGEEVRERLAEAHHEVGGFFQGLENAGIEAVPVFAARAYPFGVMTADTFEALLARMDSALDRAGPLDGLLVAPHGATVSEQAPDADGHWLSRLRLRFGPRFPIIGTLDLHGNLSPRMVSACDALISYRTNPHLDQRARGQDAASLMARTLRSEIRPTMAAEFPPFAVNIERQATAEEPCRSLYAFADEILRQPGVLSNSLLLGFPYADVPQMGAAAIVVTNDSLDRAKCLAVELAEDWWKQRANFVGHLIEIDEAMERASRLDGPVCLLDMGDNVGGGSPGDGTLLAHVLFRRSLTPACLCLYDPESVREATKTGIGSRVHLRVGGKVDNQHGTPLEADFTVRGLFDGRFMESKARHGGLTSFNQGPSAVIETDNRLTVLLTSRRMVPFSLRQLTSCGLEPQHFRVLLAKGVHAPVAAYAPVCTHLIRVNTPGVTTADLTRLAYRHRRRPMFPFEPDASWKPVQRHVG